MNIFLTFIIVLLGFGSLHSQNSFYISPLLNSKFGISSTNGLFHFSNNYPKNDYFDLYNKSVHFAPGFRIGLGLGWKNDKHKFSLDLLWNQDGSTIQNETVYLGIIESNYYSNSNMRYHIGFISNRFSLNLSKPIFKDLIDLNFGIGFIQQPGGNDNYEFIVDNDPFLYDSTKTLKVKYTTRAVSNLSLNLSFGVCLNLKWNNFYLFTLSAIYSQGVKRNLIVHENYYELTDFVSNETLKYSYSSASKGSGIFIQVSRKFQLYPWKRNAKSS